MPFLVSILQAQNNYTKQFFVTAGGQFGYCETRIGREDPKIIPRWNYFGGLNIDANYKIFGIQIGGLLEKRSTLNKYGGSSPDLDITLNYISVQAAGKFNFYGGFYVLLGGYRGCLYQKELNSESYSRYAQYIDSTMLTTDSGVLGSIGYNFLKNEHFFLSVELNYRGSGVQIFQPSFPTSPNRGLPASVYGNGGNKSIGFSVVLKQRVFHKMFK